MHVSSTLGKDTSEKLSQVVAAAKEAATCPDVETVGGAGAVDLGKYLSRLASTVTSSGRV